MCPKKNGLSKKSRQPSGTVHLVFHRQRLSLSWNFSSRLLWLASKPNVPMSQCHHMCATTHVPPQPASLGGFSRMNSGLQSYQARSFQTEISPLSLETERINFRLTIVSIHSVMNTYEDNHPWKQGARPRGTGLFKASPLELPENFCYHIGSLLCPLDWSKQMPVWGHLCFLSIPNPYSTL